MTGQFPQYSEYLPSGASRSQPLHPSLGQQITPEQRDRAERFLAEAYADGRLNEFEFDSRMDQVLGASSRRDLNQAFYGLVDVPATSQALGLHPAYNPSLVNQSATGTTGRAAAAIAHLSPFVSWIFGPLFVYLIASPRSFAKREAAKAFNFQALMSVAMVSAFVLTGFTDGGTSWLLGLLWVAWFVLTLIGGVKAGKGEDWRNPVRKVARWQILDEK